MSGSALLPLALALPWAGVLLFLMVGVRLPRELPAPASDPARGDPRAPDGSLSAAAGGLHRVSIVVPARDEARNIRRVLESLAEQDHPDFEILVVDDRSRDGTAELAESVPRGNARRIRVIAGADLPEGWLGKPWACHQGAQEAEGDVLLFTDADTWHGPQLLRRAVRALEDDEAEAVTIAGRQLMESFWERLVQPQVFTAMLVRYRDQRLPLPQAEWRSAIANGQYILIRRAAYRELGGHEALKGEVVEDLRLAQRMVRRGMRLSLRMAEDAFATRMYTNLRELVEGWSKNIVLGGMATLPEGMVRRLAAPAALLAGLVLWVLPPVVLLLAVAGVLGTPWLVWSGGVVAISALTWVLVGWRMGAPPAYGLLYPLGALATGHIFVRAWRQGGRVRWKGREYEVEPGAVTGEP